MGLLGGIGKKGRIGGMGLLGGVGKKGNMVNPGEIRYLLPIFSLSNAEQQGTPKT